MGSSKKVTIGHKYYLGMHLALCQGPVDGLLELRFQDKTAWKGHSTGGAISFHKPTLFGEKKREGGVSGTVDVLMGAASQVVNDYLAERFGALTPAFRGVTSLVFRRSYIGNSAFLRPISAKVYRAQIDDWEPGIANVEPSYDFDPANIYIALDASGSMSGAPMQSQLDEVLTFLNSLRGQPHSVKIVTYSDSVLATVERFNCETADYDALVSFVEGLSPFTIGDTNYGAALSLAPQFFTTAATQTEEEVAVNDGTWLAGGLLGGSITTMVGSDDRRKIIAFTSDGFPNPASSLNDAIAYRDEIANVEVFCLQIDGEYTSAMEQLDNTPEDGLPVLSTSQTGAIAAALGNAFVTWADMNPAHILRDVLIAKDSDGSGDESEIGDSFALAAQTLFDEKFGLSFFWQNPSSKDEFKKLVEMHIDGLTYFDRITGKWELKLIRDDYTVGALPVFDGGNVIEWIDVSRPDPAELPNQVTVTYTDREKKTESSVTLTNIAALQSQGRVINEPRTYEGITLKSLASRVCMRDLRAITNPLLTGAMRVTYLPSNINLGSPIVIHEPRLGIEPTVVRVLEIEDGNGKDNRTYVKFVEDGFSLGDEILIEEEPEQARLEAQVSSARFVEEATYFELVATLGQDEADTQLGQDPDRGFWQVTSEEPSEGHINTRVTVDDGGGYRNTIYAPFAPVATLAANLSGHADAVTFGISLAPEIVDVEQYSLARLGSEILRIDAVASAGGNILLTVGRGCLDTIPAYHSAGSKVIFYEGFAATDGTPYTAGEDVDIKLRNVTPDDIVTLAEAPVDTVSFASRAIRPYRPGNLKANGAYSHRFTPGNDVSLTWAHRDRTFEISAPVADYAQGNIGPEAGVSYQVQVEALDGAGLSLGLVVDTNVGTATSYTFNGSSSLPSGAAALVFRVKSLRGGYESWQHAEITSWLGLVAPGAPTVTEV